MKINPAEIRVDASEKLKGKTRYIRDEKIKGMWYGATVRSTIPHAKITAIRFSETFDWNTVTRVTAADIPVNYVAMLENDMPFLADKFVRYKGEPVVLIAAQNREILESAKQAVEIDYEALPANYDMLRSEKGDARIFGSDNIFKEIEITKGDPRQAAEAADFTVRITVDTGFQEHLYLEPQGMIAIPDKDRMVLRGSLQCPYYVKNALGKMFDDKLHITVIQSPTGGAFGGKEDFPSLLAGHAALLAHKCGHPVAMFYDREEDVKYTTKRHPSHHELTAYVSADGKITGFENKFYLDGGAYCTLSPVVLSRAALSATGSYFIPNVRIHGKAVATNTVPSGAFRGFGGPQSIFALEMLIEKISRETGIEPHILRRKNLIREGQQTATSQTLKYSVSSIETFDEVLKLSHFAEKRTQYLSENRSVLQRLRSGAYPKPNGDEKLRGIGITSFLHGAGFTGTGENKIKAKIRVEIDSEGYPVIFAAITEMGQGEKTAFLKIMADALSISREEVKISEVNTDIVPDSGPTVASRSTMIVGELLVEAAEDISKKISRKLREKYGQAFTCRQGYFYGGEQVIPFRQAAKLLSGLKVEKQYEHPPIIRFDDIKWKGDAYPVFSWAAAVAEIEIDPVTFEIKVPRYYTSHDIGKAINYDQAVAQIQGGSLQGIGYALYEKIKIEDGQFDITGYTDYIIPATTEMPEFFVHIMENPYPFGPFGAKGLGEMPLVGGPPAILSALWMVFGKEFNKIPVMPEDLVELF